MVHKRGLMLARMVGHITYLSEESMHLKFGRRLQGMEKYGYEFQTEFEVESYLKYNGLKFTRRFDANSYLYVTKAMDYFHLADGHGTLTEAFRKTEARFLVVSYTTDWLFPTSQSREIVSALLKAKKDVSFMELDSPFGHDAFLIEEGPLSDLVKPFLKYTRGS